MLIISKKKDYYDGVINTVGIDKTIVYDRNTIIVNEKEFPIEFTTKNWNERNVYLDIAYIKINTDIEQYIDICPFIVFFCAETHIGFKLYKKDKSFDVTYDYDYVKRFIVLKSWQLDVDGLISKIKNNYTLLMHRKYNSPIILFDIKFNDETKKYWYSNKKRELIVNPILNEYEFYKVYDTYQTFQRIQMFISGVLGNKEKDTIEIDDKYKIEQHGFDIKWSFRKK